MFYSIIKTSPTLPPPHKNMTFDSPLLTDFWAFLYNLLFNLYCACEKIFPDLDENLPLGVVFCVDHESDIIFLIRDRDQG